MIRLGCRDRPAKIENAARFFNYRLHVENTLATWVRNAMLTLRVALATYMAFSNTWTVVILSVTAIGILVWAGYRFYRNSVQIDDLIPGKKNYSMLDVMWIILTLCLTCGACSLTIEMLA